ncbi:MAG: replicative DNA helicase [Lachnospiraceae bacterium]|nr:replicative DNA helicase [Lachnospiraceae bacterium]
MDVNLDSLKRIPPHSTEAEQSVIGSMFMGREAIIAAEEILVKEDFYARQYGIIFEAITNLFNEGKPVDHVTIINRLESMQAPSEIRNPEFLASVISSVPTSANIRSYARIVRDLAVKRRLIRMNDEIASDCYEGKLSTPELLSKTESRIFELVQSQGSTEIKPISKIVLDVLDDIETAAMNGNAVTGVPTGFTDLDYKTAGFQKSDLILIAARPSMGKTAFALNIAEYAAFRKEMQVMIFSLEMSKELLVNRLIAMESYVDSQKIRTGTLSDSDWQKVMVGAGIIGRSKLVIDDTPGITVSELRSKCRRQKLEYGLDMVLIDYLQLMTGSTRYRDANRQQEISDISRSLKALARELSVPVVALSQLSRAVEARPDKRPILSDLRESGAIEQDADVVMFLYRDEYYHKDSEKKDMAEVIIAKQRNGAIGSIELAWLANYTKFANLDRQYSGEE